MTEEGEAVRDPDTGLCVRCKVQEYIILIVCRMQSRRSEMQQICEHRWVSLASLWESSNSTIQSGSSQGILIGQSVVLLFSVVPCRLAIKNLGRNATEKKILRNVWSKGDLCFRSGDILVIDII